MRWLLASTLVSGCVEYVVQAPDVEAAPPVVVEERFVQAALPEVDVLFVMDSTGSMADEQAALSGAAAEFLDTLGGLGLAYQIGVTTTDPADEGVLRGRPWIVTDSTEAPEQVLASALQVGADSAPPAAGLHTASLALADAQGFNRGFRRAEAGLHVIFVSDGDDQSDLWLGLDPASAFLTVLADDEARSGRAARVSAVVVDVPGACGSRTAARYIAVAEATGGIVQSLCSSDFSVVAGALGGAAAEYPTRFPLGGTPLEGSARVEVDGVRVDGGWQLDRVDPALVFDVAPAADAAISILYTLATEAA
ncbi:MAG: VWA domain-containing protein [Pseudomonadota bacterium]|nr:VWA domain-containing protein [Pseudomonadota bacterium]